MTRLSLLVAAVLLAGVVWAQETPVELLKNPGFDQPGPHKQLPADWTTSTKQVLWQEQAYLGKNYEIVARPGAYVLATQDITLKKGQRYTLTLRLRGGDGALGGALLLHGPKTPKVEMSLIWNIEPTPEYEDYVATFIAPDPACRLYIYNIKKSGTLAYDRVSLREGQPNQVIIQQVHFAPVDKPLHQPLVTPHIPFATPLAGGPIKAFFTWRYLGSAREMSEFAERLDLDYDLIDTGYNGDLAVSDTARRAAKRLKDNYYEVYVVPSRVTDILARDIKKRVEAGAGLVLVAGFAQTSKFLKPDQLKTVDAHHYLRSGIPWDLIPEKILGGIQVGSLGKGRVVRLVFPIDTSRVWGIIPCENSKAGWFSRQNQYWEWYLSMMAKAVVWAAHREGTATLTRAQASPAGLTIKVTDCPAGARARVMWRSGRELRFDGPLLRTTPTQVTPNQQGLLVLPRPDSLPAGPAVAEVSLLNNQGQVLTWGSFETDSPQSVRIEALTTDREAYDPGQTVKLTVKLKAAQAGPVELAGKLIDCFGRDVSLTSANVTLKAGENVVPLALVVREPLAVQHKAFVQVIAGGREQDSSWTEVRVPKMGPAQAAADFTVNTWGQGMLHPFVMAEYAQRLKQLGLNAVFAQNLELTGEEGMLAGGYIPNHGMFREKYSPGGVRSQCLSDPKVIAAYQKAGRDAAEAQKDDGPFACGIGDELLLSDAHERQELCFSRFCQARYRKWLQKYYRTIAALNKEWGTKYTDFSQVRGARTEDVRGKANFAPFVDFRNFMTDVWVGALHGITAAYHQVSPTVPIGHTNTFGANPFNGNDYWRLATQTGYGWGQEYSEAIKPSGNKAIFDLWRSFVETPEARRSRLIPGEKTARPFFNYGWIGYNRQVVAAHYEPWWLALHGSRGVSYFATSSMDVSRGISYSLLYPTLSETGYSVAVKQALADLRGGCGKLFMEYHRATPQIAILWSYPSLLVSWCESKQNDITANEQDGCDAYGCVNKSALDFRQHLNELQLDYIYVTPQQILDSDILSHYRALYLPFTVAASPALVDRLASYLNNGGVLIGDLRCLRTDEHGKPGDGSALRRLFGVTRSGPVNYGATKVTVKSAGEGIDLRGKQMDLYGREGLTLQGGTALATHATGEPAIIVQRHGQGLSIYLNFMLPEYDVTTRELVRQIVARAGVPRTVTVTSKKAGAAPPRCYELDTFTRGPISVYAFIRDYRRCSDSDPVQINFGQESYVYDMRARKYLGHVASVQRVLPPGETALYACLPYRVTGVTATAPAQVRAGTDLAVQLGITTAAGQPGDHILHVDLLNPEGQAQWEYSRNLLASQGKATLRLPLAYNEQPGNWTVKVRDVLSGLTTQTTFRVAGKGS